MLRKRAQTGIGCIDGYGLGVRLGRIKRNGLYPCEYRP
jgi:hypothetical protein